MLGDSIQKIKIWSMPFDDTLRLWMDYLFKQLIEL